MTSGVVQQLVPDLDMVNQDPPVDVVAVAVNVKFAPVLVTVMTWGKGLAPPNGFVNARAGIWEKVCAAAIDGKHMENKSEMVKTQVLRITKAKCGMVVLLELRAGTPL